MPLTPGPPKRRRFVIPGMAPHSEACETRTLLSATDVVVPDAGFADTEVPAEACSLLRITADADTGEAGDPLDTIFTFGVPGTDQPDGPMVPEEEIWCTIAVEGLTEDGHEEASGPILGPDGWELTDPDSLAWMSGPIATEWLEVPGDGVDEQFIVRYADPGQSGPESDPEFPEDFVTLGTEEFDVPPPSDWDPSWAWRNLVPVEESAPSDPIDEPVATSESIVDNDAETDGPVPEDSEWIRRDIALADETGETPEFKGDILVTLADEPEGWPSSESDIEYKDLLIAMPFIRATTGSQEVTPAELQGPMSDSGSEDVLAPQVVMYSAASTALPQQQTSQLRSLAAPSGLSTMGQIPQQSRLPVSSLFATERKSAETVHGPVAVDPRTSGTAIPSVGRPTGGIATRTRSRLSTTADNSRPDDAAETLTPLSLGRRSTLVHSDATTREQQRQSDDAAATEPGSEPGSRRATGTADASAEDAKQAR